MRESGSFLAAVSYLDDDLKRVLTSLPQREKIEEIRLREGRAVALTMDSDIYFIDDGGGLSKSVGSRALVTDKAQLQRVLLRLCGNSVFAHEQEIKNGYIALKHGSRAGVCGVFDDSGNFYGVSSINLRIARQVFGCAKEIAQSFGKGMLIAGPPCSGKTTILREAIRNLSDGEYSRSFKVAVIDSRGEIYGGGANDLGANTDVICIPDKARGAQMALRTLFPDIIAFDEIGTTDELLKVSESFNAGVAVLLTAHARDENELLRRAVTRELLQSGAIEKVALLSGKKGVAPRIIDVGEVTECLYGLR